MRKRRVLAGMCVMMLAVGVPAQTVWADTVEETSVDTAEGYDEQYPLREYKDWLAVDPVIGFTDWIWSDRYIGNSGLLETGDYTPNPKYLTTPNGEYIYRHAAEEDEFRYLMCPGTSVEMVTIARLAGAPLSGFSEEFINGEEVTALEQETQEFLNSFDWRNASDEEKAVRIVKRINRAEYDHSDNPDANKSNLTYGCLVNDTALCGGYVTAARYLGFCVNLPVSGHGVGNHMYTLFRVNGVWLSNDATTNDTIFKIYDPSEGYYMLGDIKYLQKVGEFCDRQGYQKPESLNGVIHDMNLSDGTQIYKSHAWYNSKDADVMQFR